MEIITENLGKRFVREWVFRGLTLHLPTGSRVAITGPNGSGKSSLLQVLAGASAPSTGTVRVGNDPADHFQHVVLAAPYLELIEEFTLREVVNFHRQFKRLKNDISTEDFIGWLSLEAATVKPVGLFSSGMKQRLKLGLALMSDVPIVLLDEPTANFDATTTAWYLREVQKLTSAQTLIVASNIAEEYTFCDKIIDIRDHK